MAIVPGKFYDNPVDYYTDLLTPEAPDLTSKVTTQPLGGVRIQQGNIPSLTADEIAQKYGDPNSKDYNPGLAQLAQNEAAKSKMDMNNWALENSFNYTPSTDEVVKARVENNIKSGGTTPAPKDTNEGPSRTPKTLKIPIPEAMKALMMKTDMPFQLDKGPLNNLAGGGAGAAMGVMDLLYNMYGKGDIGAIDPETGKPDLSLGGRFSALPDLARYRALSATNLIERQMTPEEELADLMKEQLQLAMIKQKSGETQKELQSMRDAAAMGRLLKREEGVQSRFVEGEKGKTQRTAALRGGMTIGGSGGSVKDFITTGK